MRRAILLTVLVAGCAHTPPPVEIREVPVPTPVECVDPAEIPPEPPTVGQRFNGDAKHDLQILAPNAQALRQWGQDLRALLEACVIEEADADAEADTADPETSDPEATDSEAGESEPADSEATD